MKKLYMITVFSICCLGISINAQTNAIPEILGKPEVYAPKLLDWKTDFTPKYPDLTEPTSNRIYDLHMQMNTCEAFDIVLSTSGNYHMALTEFWYDFLLPKYQWKNWYFSTSPPISYEQTKNKALSYSNVALMCVPHLAVGPKDIMDSLTNARMMEGKPVPVFKNRGNVLLVKKGNPKNIRSIWDLERQDIRVATSNPYTEPGSFGNYANSVYNMAFYDRGEKQAIRLFHSLFGKETKRWVVGERIHHREVPHLIYADEADVAIVFYHLARYFKKSFPDEFDVVPLGGTVENPKPIPGNKVAQLFVARIKTPLTEDQDQAREAFIREIESGNFDEYLRKHYIDPVQR